MIEENSNPHETLVTLTAEIVSAHVSNNTVVPNEMAKLIQIVYFALSEATDDAPVPEPQDPAVPIGRSVKREYIICLEDGKKMKMLKRYLRTNFDMTPEEYRAKWGLSKDYPMVAPAYAEKRRNLAKEIGLGRLPRSGRGRRKRK